MLQVLYYTSFTAVLCLLFSAGGSPVHVRRVALGGSVSTFFISLFLGPLLLEGNLLLFAPHSPWFGSFLSFGLDGVSYLFVLLSIFLTVLCILIS